MFDEPLELGCRATGGRDFTVMNLHEKEEVEKFLSDLIYSIILLLKTLFAKKV